MTALLLSMTGFGEARREQDGLAVSVEVRTINSRFFKLAVRAGDGYASLEPQIEAVVRQTIRRGTIQVNLRIDRLCSSDDFRINAEVLEGYWLQLRAIWQKWQSSENHLADPTRLESLLLLPGVVNDQARGLDLESEWPVVRATIEAALENLSQMRIDEGRVMAADLRANCRLVSDSLEQVERRAPQVVEAYRARMSDRLKKVLAEHSIALDPADVIKEVSLFAERSDISEEIVRLKSHLDQFESIMQLPESSGRKLEFLTQEMFREANTIGSKANDVEIARHVIEIKAAIERIREMIQNIE